MGADEAKRSAYQYLRPEFTKPDEQRSIGDEMKAAGGI
jgi:hypothetical protein